MHLTYAQIYKNGPCHYENEKSIREWEWLSKILWETALHVHILVQICENLKMCKCGESDTTHNAAVIHYTNNRNLSWNYK